MFVRLGKFKIEYKEFARYGRKKHIKNLRYFSVPVLRIQLKNEIIECRVLIGMN